MGSIAFLKSLSKEERKRWIGIVEDGALQELEEKAFDLADELRLMADLIVTMRREANFTGFDQIETKASKIGEIMGELKSVREIKTLEEAEEFGIVQFRKSVHDESNIG